MIDIESEIEFARMLSKKYAKMYICEDFNDLFSDALFGLSKAINKLNDTHTYASSKLFVRIKIKGAIRDGIRARLQAQSKIQDFDLDLIKSMEKSDVLSCLYEGIDKIQEECARSAILAYIQEGTMILAAKKLNTSESTVSKRVNRAILFLRGYLNE